MLLWVLALTSSNAIGQTNFDPYATSLGTFSQPTPLELNPPYQSYPSIASPIGGSEGWLPVGTIFREYLADEKASRMSGHLLGSTGGRTFLDGTLGSKFALFRRGPLEPYSGNQAFEVAVEGSAQLRIDLENQGDVQAVDFRLGLPLAYRFGAWNTRFGYYHLSSHLGDEFLLENPTFQRLNYSRDALFLGLAYSLTPNHRIYGESSIGVAREISGPLDFKFGIERAPAGVTGPRGEPFWALHGHLREEVDYGGNFTAQAGWAWRGPTTPGQLRVGLHYFNGKSLQYSFFNEHEQQLGLGVWYDY